MASVSFQSLDERRPLHNETITPENDGFSGVIFSTVEKCLRHFSDKGGSGLPQRTRCARTFAGRAEFFAQNEFPQKTI